jgi:autophagy-related protein 13
MQFQIETDDTSSFRDELSLWRSCGGYHDRPLPLIIEIYIDTSSLTSSQSLVIVDDQGKRWDVLDALNRSTGSNDGGTRKRKSEVILERWKFELKDNPGERVYDFGSTLPTVYKMCIVFFRTLYTTTKLLPAWKFAKTMGKSGSSLRLNCRILTDDTQPSRFDALTHPLYENGGTVTTECSLGLTETPVGQFSGVVTYRNDCNFRVDDSEALLSSRFMGADEHFFQPSLGVKAKDHRGNLRAAEVGSLPAHRQHFDNSEPIQAYGSLSTFHGDAPPRGSSPISALRAAKTMGSDTSSPPVGSAPKTRPLNASRASLVSMEGITMARRPSVSFQPFKAGSLSSSPGRATPNHTPGDMLPPPSPQSLPRTSGISALTQARNRSSLTAGMPATLRGGPVVPDNVVASMSSSPRPTPLSKYSSSFGHRRGRSSFGGASRLLDDDQGSSGKQSLSSSVQPGSGILTEAGAGGSSGSLQTDDDNISEFLKLLDSKKSLQSFEPSGEASTKRTSAQLSKFQSMRESHNALTESMSSSTMLHRSSSSSSRQLSSVPPMVAATSMSVSSSPGKPVSPHTPHTPAIPSRLSANSIAEYSEPRRLSYRSRTAPEAPLEDVADDDQSTELGTNAIDIPTSPRPYYPHNRRSSSVAQQHRSIAVEEDLGDLPFGVHRSISLGADDREPPSLSALLGLGQATDNPVSPNSESPSRLLQPAPHISESTAMTRDESASLHAHETEITQAPRGHSGGSMSYRPRIGRIGGRGMTPPSGGSYSSLERGSGSGTSERAGGRYSFTRAAGAYEADDEPLLFQMSEIGRDSSRKSLEENRGGGNAGTQRGLDSGQSSRRGSSHRGGW